jgi:penicillin amidase
MDVIGAGEPALPGVSIGHNGKIAFGFTVFSIDQEDLYVYETNPDDPLPSTVTRGVGSPCRWNVNSFR